MKQLACILPTTHITAITGPEDVLVTGMTLDSRQVAEGYLFAALKGTMSDGHTFINKAIEKGATSILCESVPENKVQGITYIQSSSVSKALALISAAFHDYPAAKFDLVGVTGTNGKTTTSTLLYQLFRQLGYKCGLVSTTGIKIHTTNLSTNHTTPDSITLNEVFGQMADAECDYVFMEVSSHAVVQDRIYGLPFKGGIFTNLTHDHLDYHGTFAAYRDAKKSFFDQLDNEAFALTNADDKNGKFMLQNSRAVRVTYGLEHHADYRGKILEHDIHGMLMQIDGEQAYTTLSGRFNAYNLLSVYGASQMMDVPKEKALTALTALTAVEGRFHCIRAKDITAIVDYAHTPDALQNILDAIKEANMKASRLITVIGCGGNRDKGKRPVMARIAAENSEQLILTSDNPRDEEPDQILAEMEAGVPISKKRNTLTIADRKQAIRTACTLAKSGDIILVAGKGHEKYQEIKGVKYPFDDTQVLTEYLNPTQE
ncbi:MAG: UDP-N-acetylmuramoyl-L-alanyl-D-glutamate--2,6-diaminopimelate ligase [Bacteroidota bacterium]|nr:UDP-N-acetylmuramoyl-L-alanyl-D-glutamate--2,6-diaminopimelate ligase [Bacteroidota bacterium]